jgi:hypothetical protein
VPRQPPTLGRRSEELQLVTARSSSKSDSPTVKGEIVTRGSVSRSYSTTILAASPARRNNQFLRSSRRPNSTASLASKDHAPTQAPSLVPPRSVRTRG